MSFFSTPTLTLSAPSDTIVRDSNSCTQITLKTTTYKHPTTTSTSRKMATPNRRWALCAALSLNYCDETQMAPPERMAGRPRVRAPLLPPSCLNCRPRCSILQLTPTPYPELQTNRTRIGIGTRTRRRKRRELKMFQSIRFTLSTPRCD